MLQRPELTEIGEMLLATADYIDQHGWCQNRAENRFGQVCIVGAMNNVSEDLNLIGDAAKFFRNEIMDDPYMIHLKKLDGFPGVPDWNDTPGRTKEEVITKLREAAYKCVKTV